MPLDISTTAIVEKNRLTSNGVFLLLLDIYRPYHEGQPPLRLVFNNENIVWNTIQYIAYPFSLSSFNETKTGELPSVSLGIKDIQRIVIPYLDSYGGGTGSKVTISIINSLLLDETVPFISYTFDIIKCEVDSNCKVVFTLGCEDLSQYRSPIDRFLKQHCRYKLFKGPLCKFVGEATTCNRTYTQCKSLGNQTNFGGFLGIGSKGIYSNI